MELKILRKSLKEEFVRHDIDTNDVDYILSEILNLPVTELMFVDNVSNEDIVKIEDAVSKRLNFMPVNKIFNKAYFYGSEFYIDDNVLAPRQDSEVLIEAAIRYIKQNNYSTCLDMCTGSGCLAVSIAKNTKIKTDASDISNKALDVAKMNAKNNTADINFIKSDMFENIKDSYDIIISNPPYIDSGEIENLDKEVRLYEPLIALDGGDFGLKFYNIIHDHVRKHLNQNGMLILEIGYDQKNLIISLFSDFNLIEEIKDYGGRDRVLIFKKIG